MLRKEKVLGERVGECVGDVTGAFGAERLGKSSIRPLGDKIGTRETFDPIWEVEVRPPEFVWHRKGALAGDAVSMGLISLV